LGYLLWGQLTKLVDDACQACNSNLQGFTRKSKISMVKYKGPP